MREGGMVWWMILIRGIALLLLGLLAVAWPGLTFIVIAYLFALYVLVAGVINTVYGITGIGNRRAWFLSVILGIAEIAVSIYVLRVPILTLAVFAAVVGITFMLQGILGIIVSFTDRDVGTRVFDTIGGILGIIAGFFILRYPLSGGIAFAWVIGIYGLVTGAIAIATALTLLASISKITPTKK